MKCLAHELVAAEMSCEYHSVSDEVIADVPMERSVQNGGVDQVEGNKIAGILGRLSVPPRKARLDIERSEQSTPTVNDFGYDEGWAEVFASKAPGGEVVEAPIELGIGSRGQIPADPVHGTTTHIRIEGSYSRSSRSGYAEQHALSPAKADIEGSTLAQAEALLNAIGAIDTLVAAIDAASGDDEPPASPFSDVVHGVIAFPRQMEAASAHGFETGVFLESSSAYRQHPASYPHSSASSWGSRDSCGNPIIDIALPVHGTIAERRFLAQGKNLNHVRLLHEFQLEHDVYERRRPEQDPIEVPRSLRRLYVDEERYLEDNDSDYADPLSQRSHYNEDGDRVYYLRMPIAGTIAQRRFLARGEDLRFVKLQQRSNFQLEVGLRKGKVVPADELFQDIDWNAGASVLVPEEVSPISLAVDGVDDADHDDDDPTFGGLVQYL